MTTPKTIRVQLDDDPKVGVAEGRYKTEDVAGGEFTWIRVPYRFPREARELDITIAEVKSLKQRRREARERAVSESRRTYHLETVRVVDAIEQADAEFDREREAEVRAQWEKLLRGFVGNIREMSEAWYNPYNPDDPDGLIRETVDAIEAIYRGDE